MAISESLIIVFIGSPYFNNLRKSKNKLKKTFAYYIT